MPSLPIRRIEARTYCHATEDESRVMQALDFACPGEGVARERLEGHFGNPILRISRRLEKPRALRGVWDFWRSLGVLDRLRPDLAARIDDGVLHFRLEKQAAFLKRLDLATSGDAIDVLVRIEAHPGREEEYLRVARGLVEEAP